MNFFFFFLRSRDLVLLSTTTISHELCRIMSRLRQQCSAWHINQQDGTVKYTQALILTGHRRKQRVKLSGNFMQSLYSKERDQISPDCRVRGRASVFSGLDRN